MTAVRLGALIGFFAVAGGAFGAHALRDLLAPDLLVIFETGSRYALVHAVALVAVGLLAERAPGRAATAAAVFFAVGVLIFTGSLWALALTGVRALGAVTPLGGLSLLAGWVSLFLAAGGLGRGRDVPAVAAARRGGTGTSSS